jgi:hypothetical protein
MENVISDPQSLSSRLSLYCCLFLCRYQSCDEQRGAPDIDPISRYQVLDGLSRFVYNVWPVGVRFASFMINYIYLLDA